MSEFGANVWYNGQLVPWDDATVHVSAHALHYGSSVFEGIRAYATPQGPERTREVTDAIDISQDDLDGIRLIRVRGQQNALESRRR